MSEEISKIFLKKIGLTGSEIKVYLALLKLGSSSKSALVREAKIAPSKIYEVTDKLLNKGLCSTAIRDGIKHFMAAPPMRIKEYLKKKQEEITHVQKELEKVIPILEKYHEHIPSNVKVEVFFGWSGMETAYLNLVNLAKKGDEALIIGAGAGKNEEELEIFFTKYGRIAHSKDLDIRIIFNEEARDYVASIEKNIKKDYNKRFLFHHTPTEVLIFKHGIALVIRREEPVVILIWDRETSESFKKYFDELWKIAER